MTKNIKSIFFVVTLLTLLVAVSAVSAGDVSDDTTVLEDTSQTVAPELATTTTSTNMVETSKNPEKNDKNLKEDSINIDGVDYDHVYENQEITTERIINNENENTYIKNCTFTENEDEEDFKVNNYGNIVYVDNIKRVYENVYLNNLNEESIMIINNTNLNKIRISNYGTVYIYNSTLDSLIYNYNKIIIDDLSIKGSSLIFDGDGEIITNNSAFKNDSIEYDHIYENQEITTQRIFNYQNENTYIKNCTFTENEDEEDFKVNNYGYIYIDNVKRVYENLILNNLNEESIMIINNTNLNKIRISNYGTVYIYNSTLNSLIYNYNKIIIDDLSTKGSSLSFSGDGEIITNNSAFGIYSGDNTIENQAIEMDITNNGNLNISNCTLNNKITNKGNLTLTNSTLNSKIVNNGAINIDDNTIFGENFSIEGNGELVINDISRILPYLTSINGNYTIKDITFNKGFTFNGDITLINSTITEDEYLRSYSNYGILNLKNCTVYISNRSSITNYNILIIDDDTQILSGNINGNGTVIYGERPESFNPTEFNGDNTIENMTFNLKSTNNGNLTLINCNITELITNNGNITFINSTLNSTIQNKGILTISDDTVFGENFLIKSDGEIIINDTERILPYIYITTVNVSNYNELYNAINNNNDKTLIINLQSGEYYSSWRTWTFNKENVKKIIINGNNNSLTGQLTLSTTYEFEINNLNIQGNFISNNLNNVTIKSSKIDGALFTNNKNVTLINTTRTNNGQSNNNGNMTIINSTLNGTVQNNANATLIIDDDTTFGSNFGINGAGEVITNKTILPYMNTYTGNITIEDTELAGSKTNEGSLTLNNVTLNAYTTNNGNLNINNSFIDAGIVNNGNLTISDDTEFGNYFYLNNYGNILSDIDRLLPYFLTYNGNYTLESVTFKNAGSKTNNGNLTIKNSNISIPFTNNGNLSIEDSMLNGTIYNNGVLIIDDDTTFESYFQLQGNGQVIINDTSRIAPYLNEYRGNYTIINSTVTGFKENYGNLTYINCTILASIGNYQQGNLTFINSFINGSISCSNKDTITIFDNDCTFGEGFSVTGGYGVIIMNDSSRLMPYLMYNIPNANMTIEDYTLTQNLQNFGNTTFIDSDITGRYTNAENTTLINTNVKDITNNGNLYLYNSTLNGTLTNNNNRYLVIDDDTVFAEAFRFVNYGTIVINDTNKIYPYLDTFNGTSHLSNITIAKRITNYGNLTLSNVTINHTIANTGTLIIEDDVIFAENANIISTGIIIINDTNKIYSYISDFKTDSHLTNLTINKNIINEANLLLDNCTLNSTIENYGTIIISDDTTFDENFVLSGSGEIIINDSSRLLPYIELQATEIELADGITGVQYAPTTITAYITDEYGYNINSGNVAFKDENGNILAETTVSNGVATATITFQKATSVNIIAEYTPTSIILSGSTTTGTIEIQSPETIITIEEVTAIAGQTITLTATVTDQTGNSINGGKITFKVNGKTVKDADGKVIYVKVVDGVATTEYLVPANLGGKDITITAVYSGTGKYAKANTTITTTVEKAVPTVTTTDITATAGQTITLTATITDNDKQINTGKVVFKINGKTVKDSNGKVIYAKVVNGQVSVEYTLPADMKAKDYNITATFISTEYDRLEDVKTLTIN